VGHLIALAWIALAAARPHPAEASWSAAVPMWTSLSSGGKVIAAGPAAVWTSPPPAARLGTLLEPIPPALPVLPQPRELPEVVTEESDPTGPILPPGMPISQLSPVPAVAFPALTTPEPTGPQPLAVQATRRSPGRPTEVPAARLSVPKP
jgi:hypothetical protein